MKLSAKILLIAIACLSAAVIMLICRGQSQQLSPAPLTEPGSSRLRSTSDAADRLERFANWSQQLPPLVATDSSGLLGKLHQSAEQVVLSCLPPDSKIVRSHRENSLQLLNDHTALLSGTVIVPGNQQQAEKRFFYQVQVNFLPDGSCEAAFPDFSLTSSGKN